MGRALPLVRGRSRDRGQSGKYQSRQSSAGLDTKKKTIRVSEQDEGVRAAWREQAKQLPVHDLVIKASNKRTEIIEFDGVPKTRLFW